MQADEVVRIDIRFQEDIADAVRIAAPVRLRVEESGDGVARALEIFDEDGSWTQLRFRAAPRLDMLDGMARGELSP